MKKIDTITKALEHFEWKFKNVQKPSKFDIEAYNTITQYKQSNESINLSQNENFAKLFIHQLILLSRTGAYSGERCLQVIDEILNKSVYDWSMILKEEIPMMRFRSVGLEKYPIEPNDILNRTKTIERNRNIVNDFETELTEALKHEISEDNIIKFIKSEITRTINNFEKV